LIGALERSAQTGRGIPAVPRRARTVCSWRCVSLRTGVVHGNEWLRDRGLLKRYVQRHRPVPKCNVVEVGNFHSEVLVDQLVSEGDSQGFQAGARFIVGPDAVRSDKEDEIWDCRRAVRGIR
jgi:hypothetical protein